VACARWNSAFDPGTRGWHRIPFSLRRWKLLGNQTLLITEWFAHTPREVLAKNFGISEEDFAGIPKSEKYIFPLPLPQPLEVVLSQLPDQRPPSPYTYHPSTQQADCFEGGSLKIADVRNFPETSFAATIIELEPGGMREMH
jgi:oxalate decarboxylase